MRKLDEVGLNLTAVTPSVGGSFNLNSFDGGSATILSAKDLK